MKKLLIALTLIMQTMNCFANENEIWAEIKNINTQIGQLQAKTANLPYLGGQGIEINNNLISAKRHAIGELYNGGIIFFVDETGQHGLIAAKRDTSEGVSWRNGDSGNKVTNARADGIGAGESNTRLIIAEQTIDKQPGSFAALEASNYRVLADGLTPCPNPLSAPSIDLICYSGWYLPSSFELELLRVNLAYPGLSSFSTAYYWSSTEASSKSAYMKSFPDGAAIERDKASIDGHVRPIARF